MSRYQRQDGTKGTMPSWIRLHSLHFMFVPALIFAFFFSLDILDIRNVGWLLRGDLGMSFIGWHAFRHDEWHWPLTWTYLISAPEGTSISATDSNPLASLLLKPFAGLLPDTTQFIGLWFLLSVLLTYILSYVILRRLTTVDETPLDWRNRVAIVVGAVLISLAPYLYARVYHNTLISQWIILAAIYAFIFHKGGRQIGVFAGLIALTVLVHPYFTPMVLILATFAALRTFWTTPNRFGKLPLCHTLVTPAAAYAAALALTYILAGLGQLQGQTLTPVGYFTMDPFAWFDRLGHAEIMGYEGILPAWTVGPGQHEGFQYLGLGVIATAAVAICAVALRASALPAVLAKAVPWLVMAVALLFALAVSPVVTVFGKELVDTGIQDLPLVGKFLTIFRASGRLFWPASYLVGIAAVSTLLIVQRPWARRVLVASLALQVIDLMPMAKYIREDTRQTPPALSSTATWDQLLGEAKEIVFLPADFIDTERDLFYALMTRAIPRRVSSNLMVVARSTIGQDDPVARINAMLSTTTPSWATRDRLVVLTEAFASMLACSADAPLRSKTLYRLDGVIILPGQHSHPLPTLETWRCPYSAAED
jgi:hypothetical protein